MRAFVAITLPDEVLDDLIEAQAHLTAGRGVPRENMHLTLMFLDEQSIEELEALHQELEQIRFPEFSFSLSGYGCFGGLHPRLIYADVVPNSALNALQKKVVSAARRAGIILGKRRFTPHVTLARYSVRTRVEPSVLTVAKSLPQLRSQNIVVSSISLFESKLHVDGPTYHELAKYEFC